MARLGMVIDLKRCIGCNACTIACKQEKGTPEGVNFARVITREMGSYPNTKRTYLPQLCNHCSQAACETACPTGATYTREDGIVMVDSDACIGCRACAVACPYGHRHFLENNALSASYNQNGDLTPYQEKKYEKFQEGTVVKCDLCAPRVDQGREPACVVTCPTEARIFGDWEEDDSLLKSLVEERDGEPMLPDAGTEPNVYYLPDEEVNVPVKEDSETAPGEKRPALSALRQNGASGTPSAPSHSEPDPVEVE